MSYTLPFAQPQRVTGSPPPVGTSPGAYDLHSLSLGLTTNPQAVFSNGGNTRYIIAVNTLTNGGSQSAPAATRAYLHVLKSSAGGAAGTWSEVGTVGAKELQVDISGVSVISGVWINYCVIQDCSDLIVARWVDDFSSNGAGPYKAVISRFDMALDDWGPDLSSAGDANAPETIWDIDMSVNTQIYPQLHLAKRPSDGHYFLLWTSQETITPQSYTDFVADIVDAGVHESGVLGVMDANGAFSTSEYTFQTGDIGAFINIGITHLIIYQVTAGKAVLLRVPTGLLNTSGITWQMNGPNVISSASRPFTADDIFKTRVKITGGTGWNTLWSGSAAGVVVGITDIPVPNSAIVIPSPYTSSSFPPPIGPVATLGAVGGQVTVSGLDFVTEFTRAMLSEFDGADWLPAVMCFGKTGDPSWYAASGLVVGDDSRLHALGWYEFVGHSSTAVDNSPSYQLVRTLLSDNTLQPVQQFFNNYDAQLANNAPNGPNAIPITRRVNGRTEVIWLYLNETQFQDRPFGPAAADTGGLRALRFLSADTPSVTTESVSLGNSGLPHGNGSIQSFVWNNEGASNWPGASNVLDGTPYMLTVGAGPNLTGHDLSLNLFTDESPWDASAQLFLIPGDPFPQPLGSVAGTGSYPGFIGIALTNGPIGSYEWDDIFYYEIAFSGPTALTLGATPLPAGDIGVPYSQQLSVLIGGVLPYLFTITAGSLPPGLSLNLTTGVISGTPTLNGLYTFTILLKDSICQSASQPFSIQIGTTTPLSIICDNPPNGVVGTAYAHAFPVSGGTAPYTYAKTAGLLPPGLTLNTGTGVISGTPTAYGTFSFTVQVTDSLAATADVTCSIVILAPPPPSIICDSPPVGEVGVFYSHAFPASSGLPPYTFSISGSAPPGLALNTVTGVLSGVPSASGTFDFTVMVTDFLSRSVSIECAIIIAGSTPECPGPGGRGTNDVHPWVSHYPPNS